MARLLPIIIALILFSPTPMVDTATQDDYRVEVLQVQVQRLRVWQHLGERKGWHQDAEGVTWK